MKPSDQREKYEVHNKELHSPSCESADSYFSNRLKKWNECKNAFFYAAEYTFITCTQFT